MSREALALLVCCCDFRDGAERLISSKSLRNAVIRAFPGLFRILRMCAPRHAAAVVRPRGREKSADRRRRILISRLLIIRASVPRRKSPFPAYFKGFPAVSLLIPPYPAFLKYPVSPHCGCLRHRTAAGCTGCTSTDLSPRPSPAAAQLPSIFLFSSTYSASPQQSPNSLPFSGRISTACETTQFRRINTTKFCFFCQGFRQRLFAANLGHSSILLLLCML